jgi:hypothetical protein
MLAWKVGRFSFVPGAQVESPAARGHNPTIGAFLIEALRLEDEDTRAELELPPSRRKNAKSERAPGPAFGGPASTPADFAPPSSRAPRPSELSLALDPELADWEIPSEALSAPAPSVRLPQPPHMPSDGVRPLARARTMPPPAPAPAAAPPRAGPPLPKMPPRPAPLVPRPPQVEKKRG